MNGIKVTVEQYYSSTIDVRNFRPLTAEELFAITAEAGTLLEETYGMKGVCYYKNLSALAGALRETLEFIKIAPPRWGECTWKDWEKQAPQTAQPLPVRNIAERYPQEIAVEMLHWMTHDIGEIFHDRKVNGFRVKRVLSELQYRLADIFLDYLAVKVGGKSAKAHAASMHRTYETLVEIKKSTELEQSFPRPRKKL